MRGQTTRTTPKSSNSCYGRLNSHAIKASSTSGVGLRAVSVTSRRRAPRLDGSRRSQKKLSGLTCMRRPAFWTTAPSASVTSKRPWSAFPANHHLFTSQDVPDTHIDHRASTVQLPIPHRFSAVAIGRPELSPHLALSSFSVGRWLTALAPTCLPEMCPRSRSF